MSDITTLMMGAAGVSGGFNPREHFNTVLYTGNGGTQSITGVGFQPDFVWLKARSAATNHTAYDAVRGVPGYLIPNETDAEAAGTIAVTSLDSDGFSLSTGAFVNGSGVTFAAWNWNAGGSNATNTDGTITSTVRANSTAGFSIVSYVGNGTSGATVGHGLGAVPAMFIVKRRDGVNGWQVYHQANTNEPQTDYLLLQSNAASADSTDRWNDTAPTSSVFSIGNSNTVNLNTDEYIAYCFAEVEGYSKFGSYTGNGSATGPSVTTDFQPTWLMIKRTNTTGNWILLDSARDATNPRTAYLEPNTSDAEATGNDIDFNSTGFQLKSTSASVNASGGTYIYACFA